MTHEDQHPKVLILEGLILLNLPLSREKYLINIF